jgi:hypothetical protein
MSAEKTIAFLKRVRANAAPKDITHLINEILIENKDFIEFLLQVQLSEGKDRYGNPVVIKDADGERTYYKDRTIANKLRRGFGIGYETRWITNYMSGRFYSSIEARVYGTHFTFSSAVPYYDKIIFRSGDVIMHLSEANMEILRDEIIRPQLIAKRNV